MSFARAALVAGVCWLTACGGEYESIDLGESAGRGGSPTVEPSSGSGGALGEYAGEWDGFVEQHDFSDGASRLRLSLSDTDSRTLVVGEAASFKQSREPDVWPWILQFGELPGEPARHLLAPGYEYPITTTLEQGRLAVGVDVTLPYRSWCELQQRAPGSDGCVPDWPNEQGARGCFLQSPDTETPEAVDCGKLVLCLHVCVCDDASCTAPESTQRILELSLEDTQHLAGTLSPYGDRGSDLLDPALEGEFEARLVRKD